MQPNVGDPHRTVGTEGESVRHEMRASAKRAIDRPRPEIHAHDCVVRNGTSAVLYVMGGVETFRTPDAIGAMEHPQLGAVGGGGQAPYLTNRRRPGV